MFSERSGGPKRRGLACRDRLLALAGAWVAAGWIAAEGGSLDRLQESLQLEEAHGQWSNVVGIAREILALTEREQGPNASETADALDGLARRWVMVGKPDEVGALYRRALAIREARFGPDHFETARSYYWLGVFAKNSLRDRRQAEEYLLRCLEIRERHAAEQPDALADVLVELGWLGVVYTDYVRAERFLLRVEDLVREGKRIAPARQGDALYALGWVYFGVRDFPKAHRCFERSWPLKQAGRGADHWETLEVANAVAATCRMIGQYDRAREISAECVRLHEKSFGPAHPKTAGSLASLGIAYEMSDRIAEAKPLLERAVSIFERARGSDPFPLADSRLHLSTVLHRLGLLAEAEAVQEQAVRELEKDARASLSTAQYRHLAELKLDLGKPAEALPAALEERRLQEKVVANAFSITSERQRLALISDGVAPDLLATLGAPRPLAEAVLRTKGVVLDSLLEDGLHARLRGDEAARAILDRLEDARRRRAALPSLNPAGTPPSTSLAAEARLDAEIDELESELARKTADRSPARRALKVTPDAVQQRIPTGAVLVELLRYERYLAPGRSEASYGALLLAPTGEPRWIPLGPAASLEYHVRFVQHGCRNPGAETTLITHLSELSRRVWLPIQGALPPGTSEVIVSPDGALSFVSFAALTDEAGRFLGERLHISYVSSGRDLIGPETRGASGSALWVLANPDFGSAEAEPRSGDAAEAAEHPVDVPLLRGLSFQPLPGAEAEGQLLRQRAPHLGFDRVELYVGADATEARLRRAKAPRVLHLATHGFQVADAPHSAPADSSAWPPEVAGLAAGHPMLRSGLLLAGARASLARRARGEAVPSQNDGILTAREVATLELSGTDLVVLSACDSGMGEWWAGEGVLGLRRGFVQAGARNLVLTLWPIDDRETTPMMLEFYAACQRTGQARTALAEVQGAWLGRLRRERGPAQAARLAGPLILSHQAGVEPSKLPQRMATN